MLFILCLLGLVSLLFVLARSAIQLMQSLLNPGTFVCRTAAITTAYDTESCVPFVQLWLYGVYHPAGTTRVLTASHTLVAAVNH